jgi:hypothetical protein
MTFTPFPFALARAVALAGLLAGCGAGDPADHFAARATVAPVAAAGEPDSAVAGALRASRRPAASATITPDQLFDWAERTYPQFFSSPQHSLERAPYRFRYYPETDLYLAVEHGTRVLLLGAHTGWQLVVVGDLADFASVVNPAPIFTLTRAWRPLPHNDA